MFNEADRVTWRTGKVELPPLVSVTGIERRLVVGNAPRGPTHRRAVILDEPTDQVYAEPGPPDETARAPGFATPGLAVLAALSILVGYRWLHVLPADRWTPSAPTFAAVVLPLALALTWPREGMVRRRSQLAVVAAAVCLVGVTLFASLVPGARASWVLGPADLLMAAAALDEVRAARWPPGGTPERQPGERPRHGR
ncbi:MAG: hypothetical protein ACLQPH_00205 [Acidimicrobiales bacterium]